MYSNIFLKTLRDGRGFTFWIAVGLFALGLYVSAWYPSIALEFAGMIDDLPEFFQNLIGPAAEFATPEGYFTAQPFTVIGPVLMIVLTINRGMSAVAGEEENATLDQLLGNPISRTSLIVQKSSALIVTCIPPVIALGTSITIGALIMDYTFSFVGMLQMSISMLLLTYAIGLLTLGIGAATGSKGLTLGVPSAVVAVGYIVNMLAPMTDTLSFTRYFSIMHYYIGDKPFINGITPWHALVLVGIAAISLAGGLYRFNNRDIG